MKEPIRILIIDGKLICGGVESFLMNIYRHLDRSKVQFDFLVHYKEEYFYDKEIVKMGGKIHYLTFRNDNNIIKYKKDLKSFFKSHPEYKIVWGHMDGLASIYMKVAKQCGVKYTIMHSHITNSERSLKGFIKKMLRFDLCKFTDLNFACSTEAGKYLYKKNKFLVCHNAIEIEKFKFNENLRKKIRDGFNVSDHEILIGNVGRFFPQKNHSFLIKIFNEICREYNNYKLLLCGDGDLLDECKRLVSNYCLDDKVIFAGNVKNVNEMYQAMDVFVMPSLYEGLPVSGIEAQTSGLPCVFSDTITKEVSINTTRTSFLPIDDLSVWKNKICEAKDRVYNGEDDVRNAGYDITDLVNRLTTLFIRLSEDTIDISEVSLYES